MEFPRHQCPEWLANMEPLIPMFKLVLLGDGGVGKVSEDFHRTRP